MTRRASPAGLFNSPYAEMTDAEVAARLARPAPKENPVATDAGGSSAYNQNPRDSGRFTANGARARRADGQATADQCSGYYTPEHPLARTYRLHYFGGSDFCARCGKARK